MFMVSVRRGFELATLIAVVLAMTLACAPTWAQSPEAAVTEAAGLEEVAAPEAVRLVSPEAVRLVPLEAARLVSLVLTLEEAIGIALQYNPQVGAAAQGVLASEGLVMQATSLAMPRLDVESTHTTPVDLPDFSFQSTDSTWATSITIFQPLYTGGSVERAIAAARGYLLGSRGGHRRTQQEIAFAVRQSYYLVLTTEQGVRVAEEVVASAQEHLRVARLRFQAGVAPQFDVLAAEARGARVEQGLISARAERDIAWAALSAVLGVPVPEDTELVTPPAVEATSADLATLMQEALTERGDVLAARAQVAAADALVGVARARREPTISAIASYTLREKTTISGDDFGSSGTDIVVAQNSGFVALSASWSLFNGGEVTGEIQTAEAQRRQAERQVESLEQRVELEVRSTYVLVAAAGAQVEAAQKEAAQAQEAHRIATLRYQEGVGTSVEILDAEAASEGAKTRLNGALFGLNLAVAQLDLAVGRDWSELYSASGPAEAAGE